MHYQTHLLPTGDQGQFVLAICHDAQTMGGECTRETAYTRFASGRSADPAQLQDLGAHCLLPRPASPATANYLLQQALSQTELAAGGAYGAAMSSQFLRNAREQQHQATLAMVPGVRVPRHVHASRSGRLLLGYPHSESSMDPEILPGVLRLVDAVDGSALGVWSADRAVQASHGLRKRFDRQLGAPLGLAWDGRSVLLRTKDGAQNFALAVCALDEDLPELARTQERLFFWRALTQGWLARSAQGLQWLSAGLELQEHLELPAAVTEWSLVSSADGARVALGLSSAADALVYARGGGKPRRFAPHRGARKDGWMTLAMSDCGQWLATRWAQELVLTRLADGVSWPIAPLRDQVLIDPSDAGYEVRSLVPAGFAFVGDRLLVCDQGQVRVLTLDESPQAFVSEQGRAGARVPLRLKSGMSVPAMLRAARLESQMAVLAPLASPPVTLRSKALKAAGWRPPEALSPAPLGASRLGGWPDLPADVSWPQWQERPMAFLAQINLAEMHAIEPDLGLPKTGVLSFFLGCTDQAYRNDKHRRECYGVDLMLGTEAGAAAWCVLHHPESADLQRRSYDANPAPDLFEPCAIRGQRGKRALPDENAAIYPLLCETLSRTQCDDYNELLALLAPDADAAAGEQLMGYPQLIQGTPPEMMCELAARGLNPWQYPAAEDPAYAELSRAAGQWTLLLQLTSQSAAGFEWGDGGHFYFYGKREALAKGDFSQIWVNFEN